MSFSRILLLPILAVVAAAFHIPESEAKDKGILVERKTCTAPDGVRIVYSAAGTGPVGLVFIHGGLANRSFWDEELKDFAAHYRVIAPDLAGHGDSAANRQRWGMPEFGADIQSVVEAEKLKKVVLFGNSLGGPVAIEAALLLPGKVLGVVGVDTFQSLSYKLTSQQARERADAFRDHYAASLKQMVQSLFHPDADPAVVADAERRMSRTSPQAAYSLFLSLADYDVAASARRLQVPLLAINGDLYPTDTEAVRKVRPEFEVFVMKHTGHYPMLERPVEFDRLVTTVVERLTK